MLHLRHSRSRKRALGLGQVEGPGRQGGVRKEEEPIQRNGKGDEPIDDEQPPPARKSPGTIQATVNAGLYEAANHGTSETTGGEDATPLSQLAFGVPAAQDVVRAGKGRGFQQTKEEADGHDGLRTVSTGGDHSQAGPYHHHGREEDPRL